MTDSHRHPPLQGEAEKTETFPAQTEIPSAPQKRKKSISMHEGIAVWCDCCSCEAEPYWVEVAQELGIDLGSDYEDDDTPPPP